MSRKGFIDAQRLRGFTHRGTAARDGIPLTINDRNPNTCYGMRMIYNLLTDKTGLYMAAHQVEVNLQAQTMLGYGYRVSFQASGDPVIIHGAGLEVYMNEAGINASGWMCIDLNFSTAGTPAGRFAYIKCRAHTAVTPNSIFLLEGAPTATYLLDHGQPNQAPFYDGAASASGADLYHIRCRHGGMVVRIPLYFG